MKMILSVLVAAAVALPAASRASVANDEVTSAKLKEADNTGSQDTNSGSGVKTNHLQNRAVTNAKLADGAVTDAKISGPISAAKLPVGTGPGTVAAGDHTHPSVRYAGVVTVAKWGGDFDDPVLAVSVAGAAATAADRYLVKVMPGDYDLGARTLALPLNVDLEGSGAESTVIRTAVEDEGDGSTGRCNVATVRMAPGATVRAIRIVNTGTPAGGVITALGFPQVEGKAEHVILQAGGAAAWGDRQTVCVDGAAAHATLNDAVVEGIGGSSHAVMVQAAGSVTVTNSRLVCTSVDYAIDVINTNYGVAENPGSIVVMNSIIDGSGPGGVHALYADEWNTTVLNSVIVLGVGGRAFRSTGKFRMANTQILAPPGVEVAYSATGDAAIAGSLLPGGAGAFPANVKLVNNYTESYEAIPNQ